MTFRERILAASHRQRADAVPFFHYWRHSQIGWAERQCRNRGMGMNWDRPCYVTKMHGVEISERQISSADEAIVRRSYSTPVGDVWLEEKRDAGTGQWHTNRSWRDITPWETQRLIKDPKDYQVAKYIVENTEYIADYFPIEQAMDWLGDDGLVLTGCPHSPMNTLMIDWVGSEGGRFFYHLADYPDLVEELYTALCKSREPLYEIVAHAPVPIIMCGDNLDGVLVSPQLFEKYFVPVYEQQAEILHSHGKLMAVHMDGRVGTLKNQIAATAIDIVEGLHPPLMGDLSISEALSLWKVKAIWIGFPGYVYVDGTAATIRYAIELLRDLVPGDRVAIAMSTENLVSNEHLLALTSVLERAELPLSREGIDRIERLPTS